MSTQTVEITSVLIGSYSHTSIANKDDEYVKVSKVPAQKVNKAHNHNKNSVAEYSDRDEEDEDDQDNDEGNGEDKPATLNSTSILTSSSNTSLDSKHRQKQHSHHSQCCQSNHDDSSHSHKNQYAASLELFPIEDVKSFLAAKTSGEHERNNSRQQSPSIDYPKPVIEYKQRMPPEMAAVYTNLTHDPVIKKNKNKRKKVAITAIATNSSSSSDSLSVVTTTFNTTAEEPNRMMKTQSDSDQIKHSSPNSVRTATAVFKEEDYCRRLRESLAIAAESMRQLVDCRHECIESDKNNNKSEEDTAFFSSLSRLLESYVARSAKRPTVKSGEFERASKELIVRHYLSYYV
jgi:hypothetical protein